MLKVTTKEQRNSVTFILEGRLCHPWTQEVERGWSKLMLNAANKELTLDLDGVTFVDRDGEALLASMLERGTKVRASGVLIRHMVEQVQKRVLRKSPRSSRGTLGSRHKPSAP
jgi:anti-anti-sigma regulatory factor